VPQAGDSIDVPLRGEEAIRLAFQVKGGATMPRPGGHTSGRRKFVKKTKRVRDILLRNRAWNRRAMASGQPLLYWALPIAPAIAAVVLIMCFGIQQQRAL
jgi:hypothetical protein